MIWKIGPCLVFAAAFLVTLGAMGRADAGSVPPGWSAQRNVIQSQRYDRMLETNRAFRMARMRKECGPIRDPQLHAGCLASFSQNEPFVGSSTARRNYGSSFGQ